MDILSRQLTTVIPDMGLKCNSVYGSTSLYTVPAELSLCVTLKITAEQYTNMTASINILGSVNGTSWFNLIRRHYSESNDRIQWEYKNSNVMTSSVAAAYSASYTPTITDGQPHRLVCCINATENKIKAFLDGVLISTVDLSTTPPVEFTATNCFRLGTLYPKYPLQGGGVIFNVKYFNFDISADGAAYTLDDYQADRDVPDALSSAYIVSPDKVYPTVDSTTNTSPSVWIRNDNTNNPTYSYTTGGRFQITAGTITSSGQYATYAKLKLPRTLKTNEPITFNFYGDGTSTRTDVDVGAVVYIGTYGAISTSAAGTGKILCNGAHTFTNHPETDYIMIGIRNSNTYPEVAGAVYTFPKFSVSVAGKVLELTNELSDTTWTDESGNGYDMTLQGDFEIVDI